MSELIAPNDVIEAWDRLARTPDGLLIYRHLQFIALGTERAGNDSALPRLEGRRRLAADLMGFMSDGIRDYDRASVTFTLAKPADTGGTRPRGAGRRVTADTFIPGYDTEPRGPGNGGAT
jgi:hypothetical protein